MFLKVVITDGITGEFSLENGRRERFSLEVIEMSNPDKPIGIWSSENPESIHLTRNATERERELQQRMQSYNFIVSSKLVLLSKKIDILRNLNIYVDLGIINYLFNTVINQEY